MEIWEITKPLNTNMGSHKVGDLLYREPYTSMGEGEFLWHPFKGGYAIWERQIDVKIYAKKVSTTKKPKSYFINKIYTQEQVDNMKLKNK